MAKERLYIDRLSLFLFFFQLPIFIAGAQDQAQINNVSNSSLAAIFVFGDSTVDPGNNNYMSTLFKSNFLPYGRDLPTHQPTGRFSNGRLATDFIASYVGLKDQIPPYLDSTLSLEELMTGVSFASAGSGYDPLTPKLSLAMEITKQLDYFKEYLKRLELMIGKKRTQELIRKSAFIISAGTNDFVIDYYTLPVRRRKYTVQGYQPFLLDKLWELMQGLKDLGVRKMAVAGLPPMGCLPIVITARSPSIFGKRGCMDSLNSVAADYNLKLQNKLVSMQQSYLPEDKGIILYCDIYKPLLDMVQSPSKYGFEDTTSGCCGTGLFEAAFMCNPNSHVCEDASKYVFWDAIHPTDKAYYIIFYSLRNVINQLLD